MPDDNGDDNGDANADGSQLLLPPRIKSISYASFIATHVTSPKPHNNTLTKQILGWYSCIRCVKVRGE
jgi:hypothetical protein